MSSQNVDNKLGLKLTKSIVSRLIREEVGVVMFLNCCGVPCLSGGDFDGFNWS